MSDHPTWFSAALAENVSRLGTEASSALRILSALPVGMARDNIAQGLAYAGSRGRSLWRHQEEAIVAIRRHLSANADPTAAVIMPTGSGKTEVILRTVEASGLDAGRARIAVPTIVLEPTRQLVAQTRGAFQERFPNLHVSSLGEEGDRPGSVTVMTYSLFIDMLQDGRLSPADVKALAMDEAHRGLSDLRQGQIGRLLGNTVVTAYSASPAFDVVKNVHALLGPRNEVLRIDDERMRREGIISPVIDYILKVAVHGHLPTDPRLRSDALRQACANAVLGFVGSHSEDLTGIALKDKTYFGFANGIDRARDLAGLLAGMGMPAGYVSGKDGPRAIAASLARLRAGDLQVIVNDQVLVEGTDVPEARGVLAFFPTTSLVKHLQRCGRARRIDPRFPVDDPRQVSSIVECLVEVNGITLEGQRTYAEAIEDLSIARVCDMHPQSTEALVAQASRAVHGPVRPGHGTSVPPSCKLAGAHVSEPARYVVSTKLDSVRMLLADRDSGASSDRYVNAGMIATLLRADARSRVISDALRGLRVSLDSGQNTVIAGRPVRAIVRLASGHETLCVHEDDIDAFRALPGFGERLHPRSPGWLSFKDLVGTLGISPTDGTMGLLWEEAVSGRLTLPHAPDGGPGIRYMSRSLRGHWVHPSAVAVFERALGRPRKEDVPPKEANHLSIREVYRKLRVRMDDPRLRAAWERLVDAPAQDGLVHLDGTVVDFRVRRPSSGPRVHCLEESHFEWFAELAGIEVKEEASPQTEEWLNMTQSAAAMGCYPEIPGFREFWRELDALTVARDGIAEPSLPWRAERRKQPYGPVTVCLHRDDIPRLASLFRRSACEDIDEAWHTPHSLKKAYGVDFAPNSFAGRRWAGLLEDFARDPASVPYRIGHRGRGGLRTACIHVDDADRFIGDLKRDRDATGKSGGWLGKEDVFQAFAVGKANILFAEAWRMVEALVADGPVMDGERVIMAEVRMTPGPRVCLHESELPWLAALSGLRLPVTKSQDMASITDIWGSHGQTIGNALRKTFRELARQLDAGEATVLPDGKEVRFYLAKAVRGRTYCIHRDDIAHVVPCEAEVPRIGY